MKNTLKPFILLFAGWIVLIGSSYAQRQRISDNHTILLYNRNGIIPFKRLDTMKIAVVTPNKSAYPCLVRMLQKYGEVTSFDFSNDAENTKAFNTIILVGSAQELNQNILLRYRQLASAGKNVIVCSFLENKYALYGQNPRFGGQMTEMVSNGKDCVAQENMAMSIFGGMSITQGLSINRTEQTRLQYAQTTLHIRNKEELTKKIDAIAAEAIQAKATPGMVVMALKNNQVLFEKSYGYHTYEKKQPTQLDDIFDLASISKIVGTTPVIMHLQEQGKIDLEKTIGDYLEDAAETNKADIPLRTVLLHEAGFTPFIPFYKDLKKGDLQTYFSDTHQTKVADGVYLLTDYYKNVMWPEMLKSSVKSTGNYVYSDISMYVMKEVVEQVSSTPLNKYVSDFLYKPIGMKTAGYNPRDRFESSRIVPTQQDMVFRKVLLQGYVHDEGAAMAGGIAGHAGLFATANDLAIYGQMLLNRGEYGGVRYFQGTTIDLFTSRQSSRSRRGLGFDRYDPNSKNGYPSKLSNNSVYGHTGYTGTCIWIDPKNQLVYIFLSNRVHPQVTNKLIDLNIRGRIQDAIYETILNKR
ncbi:serine hydrolase [Parapusillimonas sp. SGNA-6]|uniref:serine hydrolase domain-containing protein n=1 Tax=Parapedobacter sp. SGR-10 TaxID=2710879 RepID=UPI0013D76792|nr:serine hydrolase [Parapedobacter sp. SGR-10]NGF55912.1 serine hydrolase [Parapedobacter sp. SGR-10]NGM89385.1 serine hydrolase [Parapusillimonas sp. SGNA-6]